jgi:transposase, IS5 family
MGVKRVCIPDRSSKNRERKRQQKKRWFRSGQKWRTGCEGRISVVKRDTVSIAAATKASTE